MNCLLSDKLYPCKISLQNKHKFMGGQVFIRLLAFTCLALGSGCLSATAQVPFYKGKRLTVLINFAPGGGVDISGRLFARHLVKHIEGNPTVIVQNIDGAGGINGVAYLGEVAPKDGTVLGYLGATPWQFVSNPKRFRVDLKTYEFVGYEPITTIYVIRSDAPPGMQAATDIAKAQGLVSGGLSATHARDLNAKLTLDMLGVPYRHVTGYSSTERARLALQRGEIHFTGETTPAYRGPVSTLVSSGDVIPVFYNPGWNGKSLSVPKQVEDLSILPFQELYRQLKGNFPSGQLWEAYLANLALTSTMARLYALPPGSPPAAVNALRAAVRRLNNDTEFMEQAKKTIGYVMESEASDDANEQVRHALSVSPSVMTFVDEYLKRK